ncbi:hypothetical protein GJ496_000165 [Pomphorhynchus laevis]|nr:hypothetical protein GJ496_000165 [Pomphorhynchus laevis]
MCALFGCLDVRMSHTGTPLIIELSPSGWPQPVLKSSSFTAAESLALRTNLLNVLCHSVKRSWRIFGASSSSRCSCDGRVWHSTASKSICGTVAVQESAAITAPATGPLPNPGLSLLEPLCSADVVIIRNRQQVMPLIPFNKTIKKLDIAKVS